MTGMKEASNITGANLVIDGGWSSVFPGVLELDSGEEATARAGDVVIRRGTNHLWHNRRAVPCRFAWILLDADAVEIAGQRLGASWRHDT